jgi:hypothetical protein
MEAASVAIANVSVPAFWDTHNRRSVCFRSGWFDNTSRMRRSGASFARCALWGDDCSAR